MKFFMQGMRRSGTTIIFDCLSQDERLDLYYEPFSAAKRGANGGGSGMQKVDFMEKIAAFRTSFIEANRLDVDPSVFNYGAPRNPELEIRPDLPALQRQYLTGILERGHHTVVKFVRMYCKASVLDSLADDGFFALLVRHPQEVVASYMYGRDQKRFHETSGRERFFTLKSDTNPWNSFRLLEFIAKEEGRPELVKMPDWMRYLALWKYTFDRPFREGRAAFGERFLLVRYEDLTTQPIEMMERLYDHVGLTPSAKACDWAHANLRPNIKECYADDDRWLAAYQELGLYDSLSNAGYPWERPALADLRLPKISWYRRLLR